MPTVELDGSLRAEYQQLFDTCIIRPNRLAAIDTAVTKIERGDVRYRAEANVTGVPWHVIAILNALECNLRFDRHLHNGDPLTAQTVHVPVGRPPGVPPFTWEQSATDALNYSGLTFWADWSVPGTLYQLEKYNGFGYRLYHPEVPSPYLWSFSTHYSSGKYTADGTWSPTARSSQCGAAVLLRRMAELNVIEPAQEMPAHVDGLTVHSAPEWRPTAPKSDFRLAQLQRFLNSLPNVYVPPDGRLGPETLAAVHRLIPTLAKPGSQRRPRSMAVSRIRHPQRRKTTRGLQR